MNARPETKLATFARHEQLLFGVFLLPVFVYWSTATAVASVWWRSDTFAHGMIVFPLALYLLFERRDRLSGVAIAPSLSGAVVLLCLSLAWYLSVLAKAAVMQQLSLALMMSACVLMVFGSGAARRLAFPLLYVLFAVPLGEFLIGPLMSWTAEFTVFALQLTGIPVFREGMFFKIPSGNFEVAKACSGIRYLIASVALGVLYANLFLKSRPRQLVFVGVAIVLPVIANGFRAYGIVMLAHLSDMKLAVGVDHIIYGWVFFGLVMFLMFSFGWWLKKGEGEESEKAESGSVTQRHDAAQGAGRIGAAIVIALAIMLFPKLLLSVSASQPGLALAVDAKLPAGQGDWQGPLGPEDPSWSPTFEKALTRGLADYRRGDETVTVFLATFDARSPDTEMVTWENKFYEAPWKAMTSSSLTVALPPNSWTVREQLLVNKVHRKLVWSWYETDSIKSGSDLFGKFAETLAALPLKRETPRALAMATDVDEDVVQSRARLESFFKETYAGLQECIAAPYESSPGAASGTSAEPVCQVVAGR